MKILVTGGAGFIGSWLVEGLLEEGHAVTVLDAITSQVHGAVPHLDLGWLQDGAAEFIRGDIRDSELVDGILGRVEAVVHLAAETGTGQSYNVGGGNEWRNVDLAKLLCRLVDEAFANDVTLAARFPLAASASGRTTALTLRFVDDRLGHDDRYAINASRIRAQLEFKPAETFDTGIRKTVRWYLGNAVWWKRLVNQADFVATTIVATTDPECFSK